MDRAVVRTEKAPEAIGPYNQGVRAGSFVFTAGQVALVPGMQEIAAQDVAGQTEQVLRNLAAVLEGAGSSLERVVKTTVYLKDMADFAEMNAVYERYFCGEAPARSTVAVRELPLGARVEIEAIALAG